MPIFSVAYGWSVPRATTIIAVAAVWRVESVLHRTSPPAADPASTARINRSGSRLNPAGSCHTNAASAFATTASLASLKPGAGYDYAFVTKVYASLAAGCPVVFTGAGPAGPFIRDAAAAVSAGVAVPYDVASVAQAMDAAAASPAAPDARRHLSAWTRRNHSLNAVAERIVAASAGAIGR